MSYDPRCLELAEVLLSDEPTLKHLTSELAEHIQAEIEGWVQHERRILDQLDARLDEQQRQTANCPCDILHPRV